jgi:hypothetical protein
MVRRARQLAGEWNGVSLRGRGRCFSGRGDAVSPGVGTLFLRAWGRCFSGRGDTPARYACHRSATFNCKSGNASGETLSLSPYD